MGIYIPQTAIEYVDRALLLARKRYEASRSMLDPISPNSLEIMYDSIVQQLLFVRQIITGEEKDKAKLWKLTFGMYAGKEFDTSDPVFSSRLGDVYYIVSQIRKGLKVQLPHEVAIDYKKREEKLRADNPRDFENL
jgi:hypothetical protein